MIFCAGTILFVCICMYYYWFALIFIGFVVFELGAESSTISNDWLLQGHLQPEEEVYSKWRETHYIRRKLLEEARISVAAYYEKYKCLAANKLGINLVSCKETSSHWIRFFGCLKLKTFLSSCTNSHSHPSEFISYTFSPVIRKPSPTCLSSSGSPQWAHNS